MCDAEHQKAVINHQKVGVGVTASTFKFAKHQKSRGDIMKQIWGHSIKKASKHSILGFDALKDVAKSQYFQGFSDFLSHSKTVGRGFKSYCPCQKIQADWLGFFHLCPQDTTSFARNARIII